MTTRGTTFLDLALPNVCSACGRHGIAVLKQVTLVRSRGGFRLLKDPGLVISAPLCAECAHDDPARHVCLAGVKRSFFGKVTKVILGCRNEAFACAFREANKAAIGGGFLEVVGGI